MISMMKEIQRYLNEIEEKADPRVQDWFLMSSPIIPFIIILLYLYFVTKLGPQLMKNRPPMQIDIFMIVYNIVQIIISAYIFEEACRLLWFKHGYNFLCIEIDYSNTPLGIQRARTVWMSFMAKVLDLLDTIFFVLRKKQSQVTFLHVYHHAMVFSYGWFITKFYPGGHIAFFGTVNAFVHTIMYTYYLISALHILENQTLWWKKYITQLQLLQFFITGIHGSMALMSDCNYPKILIVLGMPQNILMIILFYNFYKKTYLQKQKKIKETIAKNNGIRKNVKKVL